MDELNFTRSLFKYTMSKKSILSVVLNIVILFIMALLFTLIQNAYQINTIYSFSFALIFGLIFWILFYLIIGLVCETSKEKEINLRQYKTRSFTSDFIILKKSKLKGSVTFGGLVLFFICIATFIILYPYIFSHGEIRMILGLLVFIFIFLFALLFSLYQYYKD